MVPQFRNIVFEGGGVKGIAFVGAMEVLQNRGLLHNVTRVGGASAGAINALIFALGYTISEQRDILASTDFTNFMDESFGAIRDVRRLAKKFGWHKGNFFTEWIEGLIESKLGNPKATFADLHTSGMDLYVIAANLSTGFPEVFSAEHHPEMEFSKAIRMSMSIPLFFQAVRYGDRDDVYVDGGVMRNYPVKLFDRTRYVDMAKESGAARPTEYYNQENVDFDSSRSGRSLYVYNRQTLGIRLDTSEEIGLFRYHDPLIGKPIRKFTEFARALMGAIMNVQENQHLHSDDWERTVYLNTLDVQTTDFDLSDEKKEALIQEGIKGAETYLKWFEDVAENPVNRMPAI